MTRQDMIAAETFAAKQYRREAARRHKAPEIAAVLTMWAEASEKRAEALRFGPLFAVAE